MKKTRYFVLLFVAFIISIGIVSAISTNLEDNYLPGETIITQISGSILEPIDDTNIELKRANVLVPFDYEVKKLGDGYYLWLTTPLQEKNYSLKINDITTYVSGKVEKINYEKNFSVSGNLSDYSIKPGIISTDKDFEIIIQFNEDFEKSIDVNFVEGIERLLKPGENTIKFSIGEINESKLFNITLGKYNVPAYVKINKTNYIISNESFENLTDKEEIIILDNIGGAGISTSLTKLEASQNHCYEFPGKICAANEVCSGQPRTSLEGICCVGGSCKVANSSGSSYAWIGYLIGAIVIIGGVIIWVRYKKVKKDEDPLARKMRTLDKKVP